MCLAYEIYKMICDNFNICVALDNFCDFINISTESFYNISKNNSDDIINNNNINNNNNMCSSGSNNIYINNNSGEEGKQGERVSIKYFDLLKRIYNDMKGTHERRMSSSGVNPVAELAILNHHFNYTNRPMETEQRTVEQNNLPKLSLSDGQNTNILSNNDNI